MAMDSLQALPGVIQNQRNNVKTKSSSSSPIPGMFSWLDDVGCKEQKTQIRALPMRYYFHAVSRGKNIPDPQGIELTDDEAKHIGSIIHEMRMEEPELFDVSSVWAIEIVNEKGHTIARFPVGSRSLAEAIEAVVALKGRRAQKRSRGHPARPVRLGRQSRRGAPYRRK
jgi:hypothetical protein